jgi:hypothetical protein
LTLGNASSFFHPKCPTNLSYHCLEPRFKNFKVFMRMFQNVRSSEPYKVMLQMYNFTSFLHKMKYNLLVERVNILKSYFVYCFAYFNNLCHSYQMSCRTHSP